MMAYSMALTEICACCTCECNHCIGQQPARYSGRAFVSRLDKARRPDLLSLGAGGDCSGDDSSVSRARWIGLDIGGLFNAGRASWRSARRWAMDGEPLMH